MLAGPVPGHPLEPRVSHQHEPGDAGPRGAPFCTAGFSPNGPDRTGLPASGRPGPSGSPSAGKKTPMRGGKLFKIAGIVSCTGSLVPDLAILFILVPVLAGALATAACSYYAFRKEGGKSWSLESAFLIVFL